MAIKIGNSPESWGIYGPSNQDQISWERCLDEISSAGYQWLELGPYGYLPTNPVNLRKELRQRGLNIIAGGILAPLENESLWSNMQKEVLKTGELLASVDAKFLLVIDDFYRYQTGQELAPNKLDNRSWAKLIETLHKLANLVRNQFNLQLAFHPCADTHVQYENQINTLIMDTNPDWVTLCLDTGHHAYRFGDPVSFMKKHHSRIGYLHLKGVDPKIREQVNKKDTAFMDAVKLGVMCEPALGAIDFTMFAKVLHEIGYDGYATVEQDMYRPDPNVPLQIASRTRKYLNQIGIG